VQQQGNKTSVRNVPFVTLISGAENGKVPKISHVTK